MTIMWNAVAVVILATWSFPSSALDFSWDTVPYFSGVFHTTNMSGLWSDAALARMD